jgi:hypothetical protein
LFKVNAALLEKGPCLSEAFSDKMKAPKTKNNTGFAVNEEKREAGGQSEFSVGLAARRDVASQPAT